MHPSFGLGSAEERIGGTYLFIRWQGNSERRARAFYRAATVSPRNGAIGCRADAHEYLKAITRATDPPPQKWSDLRYVFGHGGGLQCRGRDTSRKRLSLNCDRLTFWSRRARALSMRSVRSG